MPTRAGPIISVVTVCTTVSCHNSSSSAGSHCRWNQHSSVVCWRQPSWRNRRNSLLQDLRVDKYCTLILTLTFRVSTVRLIHCLTYYCFISRRTLALSYLLWSSYPGSGAQFYIGAGGNCPPSKLRPWPQNVTNGKHRHIAAKSSVLWPSKYAKMRFWLGLGLGPRWGSSRRYTDPLVGWGGHNPFHDWRGIAPLFFSIELCLQLPLFTDCLLHIFVVTWVKKRK